MTNTDFKITDNGKLVKKENSDAKFEQELIFDE